jgi:hypothetical protein
MIPARLDRHETMLAAHLSRVTKGKTKKQYSKESSGPCNLEMFSTS